MGKSILSIARENWKKTPEQKLVHKINRWRETNKPNPDQMLKLDYLKAKIEEKEQKLIEEYRDRAKELNMEILEGQWEIINGND